MKLIPDRECGDCTVCCTILEVDADNLKKPAGKSCQHLSEQGCGIYEQRPPVCQQWFCMWRWFPFANHVRPDKSNILISYENHPKLQYKVIVARDISPDNTAFRQPGFEHIIQSMLSQGLEVWCYQKDRPIFKSTVTDPLGLVDEHQTDDETAPDINVQETKDAILKLLS